MSAPATPFAFRETPVHVPAWFLGIIEKHVPEPLRASAIHDYAVAQGRQPLTRRQHQVFKYLATYITAYGFAPSCQEIADHLVLSSLATVIEHLRNLERKGWITRRCNEARAITLVEVPE